MGLKSVLTGKVGIAIAGVVVLLAALGGAFALGVVGAPSVQSIDNRFSGVNETTTTIGTDLTVTNPNPVGVNLGGVDVEYTILLNDVEMANGSKNGVAVETGNSTLNLTTYMANERIPAWWVSHISNDEHTDLRIEASVSSATLGRTFQAPPVTRDIDTNIIGAFNADYDPAQELNANREPAVQDPVLYLNSTSGSWAEITEEETTIDMAFTVYNPKSYPISVSEVGYDISMNNVSVGEGQTSQSYTLPPGETTTIETTTVIDNTKLDEWWVSHLERGQVTTVAIDIYMRFDLSAVGAGSVRIPFDTVTQTVETDFFGNKDGESGGTGDGGDGDTSDSGDTATASDDGSSTTSEPTTSSETTSSETTTTEETTTSETTSSETTTTEETTTSETTTSSDDNGTTTDDGGLL
jgi:LEA14-like dessication related protein